jgi:hypothetical protein
MYHKLYPSFSNAINQLNQSDTAILLVFQLQGMMKLNHTKDIIYKALKKYHILKYCSVLTEFLPAESVCRMLCDIRISRRSFCLPNATAPLVTMLICLPCFCNSHICKNNACYECMMRTPYKNNRESLSED